LRLLDAGDREPVGVEQARLHQHRLVEDRGDVRPSLRQPGGFEGLCPVRVSNPTYEPAFLNERGPCAPRHPPSPTAVRTASLKARGVPVVPTAKTVVYSKRLNGLSAGEQLEVRAKIRTSAARLGYPARILDADLPRGFADRDGHGRARGTDRRLRRRDLRAQRLQLRGRALRHGSRRRPAHRRFDDPPSVRQRRRRQRRSAQRGPIEARRPAAGPRRRRSGDSSLSGGPEGLGVHAGLAGSGLIRASRCAISVSCSSCASINCRAAAASRSSAPALASSSPRAVSSRI
jgi:hypothetical protein